MSEIPSTSKNTLSFVIRLWLERDASNPEWRGHVVNVQNQEEAYFRDFNLLLNFLNRHANLEIPLRVV